MQVSISEVAQFKHHEQKWADKAHFEEHVKVQNFITGQFHKYMRIMHTRFQAPRNSEHMWEMPTNPKRACATTILKILKFLCNL